MSNTKHTVTIPIEEMSIGQPDHIVFEYVNGNSKLFFTVGDKKYSMKVKSGFLLERFLNMMDCPSSDVLGEEY